MIDVKECAIDRSRVVVHIVVHIHAANKQGRRFQTTHTTVLPALLRQSGTVS